VHCIPVRLQNANVYFKNEFQHPTGSFKERGGRNALMQLCESGRSTGRRDLTHASALCGVARHSWQALAPDRAPARGCPFTTSGCAGTGVAA